MISHPRCRKTIRRKPKDSGDNDSVKCMSFPLSTSLRVRPWHVLFVFSGHDAGRRSDSNWGYTTLMRCEFWLSPSVDAFPDDVDNALSDSWWWDTDYTSDISRRSSDRLRLPFNRISNVSWSLATLCWQIFTQNIPFRNSRADLELELHIVDIPSSNPPSIWQCNVSLP